MQRCCLPKEVNLKMNCRKRLKNWRKSTRFEIFYVKFKCTLGITLYCQHGLHQICINAMAKELKCREYNNEMINVKDISCYLAKHDKSQYKCKINISIKYNIYIYI